MNKQERTKYLNKFHFIEKMLPDITLHVEWWKRRTNTCAKCHFGGKHGLTCYKPTATNWYFMMIRITKW